MQQENIKRLYKLRQIFYDLDKLSQKKKVENFNKLNKLAVQSERMVTVSITSTL